MRGHCSGGRCGQSSRCTNGRPTMQCSYRGCIPNVNGFGGKTIRHIKLAKVPVTDILKDRAFLCMSHVEWTNVLLPKVQGNWNLHKVMENQPLGFFVSFSSISGLLSQPGQANYAAANTFPSCSIGSRLASLHPSSTRELSTISAKSLRAAG